MSERTELRTPLELVNEMDRVLHFMRKGTRAVHDMRTEFLNAKSSYLAAFLDSKSRYEGTKDDRENRAQRDNWSLYTEMTQAEAEYQYGRDKLADLEKELSKLQTESRLVIKEMEMTR